MADETSEKKPKAQPEARGGDTAGQELGPEFEWHLRAHPPAELKPPAPEAPKQPAAGPGAKAEGKPEAPAKPGAPPGEAKPEGTPIPKPQAPAAAEKPVGAPAEKPAAAAAEQPAAAPAAGEKPPAPAKPLAAAAPPAKPAAPPPKKEEPPKPAPLENELVKRLKGRFGEAIGEATEDRKQQIVVVDREKLREVACYCRDEEQFNFLTDLTAVDWPKREKRFEVVLNLYSFKKNERLRLKAQAAAGEKVPSVVGVWSTANWLERECFDMFGIEFEGHPDLRRILLPEEWQGHPLRKDYDILTQDAAWVKENLGVESGQ